MIGGKNRQELPKSRRASGCTILPPPSSRLPKRGVNLLEEEPEVSADDSVSCFVPGGVPGASVYDISSNAGQSPPTCVPPSAVATAKDAISCYDISSRCGGSAVTVLPPPSAKKPIRKGVNLLEEFPEVSPDDSISRMFEKQQEQQRGAKLNVPEKKTSRQKNCQGVNLLEENPEVESSDSISCVYDRSVEEKRRERQRRF